MKAVEKEGNGDQEDVFVIADILTERSEGLDEGVFDGRVGDAEAGADLFMAEALFAGELVDELLLRGKEVNALFDERL